MAHWNSARSLPRVIGRLAAAVTMAICATAANAQHAPLVKIVSDTTCPIMLESVTVHAEANGVSITYSIRNGQKDAVREVVVTAAAVNFLGEVVSVRMQPVATKIAGRSSQHITVEFPDLELQDADAVSVGVQGVRWSGRRQEWRTALRVGGPTVPASKK